MKIVEEYDFHSGIAHWSIYDDEDNHVESLFEHDNEMGTYTYFALREAFRKMAAAMEWKYSMDDVNDG